MRKAFSMASSDWQMRNKHQLILGACGILQDQVSALSTCNHRLYHLFIHQTNIFVCPLCTYQPLCSTVGYRNEQNRRKSLLSWINKKKHPCSSVAVYKLAGDANKQAVSILEVKHEDAEELWDQTFDTNLISSTYQIWGFFGFCFLL